MSLLHVDVLAGAASFPANFGLPNVKGMYRYRIMCCNVKITNDILTIHLFNAESIFHYQ